MIASTERKEQAIQEILRTRINYAIDECLSLKENLNTRLPPQDQWFEDIYDADISNFIYDFWIFKGLSFDSEI